MWVTAAMATIQVLLIGVLLVIPTFALADDGLPETPERPTIEREILMSADLPRTDTKPFHDRFFLTPQRGIEYRQNIPVGDRRFSLRLYGPIVKDKPGLGLRLQGTVGGIDFKLKGYGTIKKQGIVVGIDF